MRSSTGVGAEELDDRGGRHADRTPGRQPRRGEHHAQDQCHGDPGRRRLDRGEQSLADTADDVGIGERLPLGLGELPLLGQPPEYGNDESGEDKAGRGTEDPVAVCGPGPRKLVQDRVHGRIADRDSMIRAAEAIRNAMMM
jgi:hypothetical protein